MTDDNSNKGERIAKVMARAGLCSRREAERWITDGRVKVDGKTIDTPATLVTSANTVEVDGKPLPQAQEAMLWRYHKPPGLVTTHKDEQGRQTVFDTLPPRLGRVISVGRLDLNSEGLLLLTNDGGLARELELPSTGWIRTYRVRVFGHVTDDMLESLKDGLTVDGVKYGSIDARIEKKTGRNAWLIVSLAEGKNREIRRVMEHLDLQVNRLIRQSYGPFRLDDLDRGDVAPVPRRQMIDQLGLKLEGASEPPKKTSKAGWAKSKTKPKARPKAKKPVGKKPMGKKPGKPRKPRK